jgi:NAD-dependent dihydropyrimidine dehydrogenase PreA subunit
MAQVFGIFALLDHLPVVGAKRWLTYGGAALLGSGAAAAILLASGAASGPTVITSVAVSVVSMLVLSADLAGTTPWYSSTINSLGNSFMVELDEERCTGAAACVQVCPRDVLKMNGKRRKVELVHPEDCIRCGACIVQCPDDALHFRFDDGRLVDPETVRTTRLNMLGRRRPPVRGSATE